MKTISGGFADKARCGDCSPQGDGDCEGCDGSGVRCPAEPSCILSNLPRDWVVVERCDYCERYPDDLAAARVVCEVATWMRCSEGGLHAVGRLPTH
jgi:hypothetical protein